VPTSSADPRQCFMAPIMSMFLSCPNSILFLCSSFLFRYVHIHGVFPDLLLIHGYLYENVLNLIGVN
jgi:hypothetical protein